MWAFSWERSEGARCQHQYFFFPLSGGKKKSAQMRFNVFFFSFEDKELFINKRAGKDAFPSLSRFSGKENPTGTISSIKLRTVEPQSLLISVCPSFPRAEWHKPFSQTVSRGLIFSIPSLPSFHARDIPLRAENRHLQDLSFIKTNPFLEIDPFPYLRVFLFLLFERFVFVLFLSVFFIFGFGFCFVFGFEF